jgi:LacI family transcriptional regulator
MSGTMPGEKKPSDKRPTIYDVARHAGVSPGTASRVLNNRDRVDPTTRARVLSSVKALNLKPRAGARMQQIAVLSEPRFHDRIEGYAARLTSYLSFALSRRNATVVHPSDPAAQLPGIFLDGIIAVTAEAELIQLLATLEGRIPVIYVDRFDCKPDQYAVCSDHHMAGYIAGKHLIARGKKKLAIVGADILPMQERLRGYRQAMAEADIAPDEQLLKLIGGSFGSIPHATVVTQKIRAGADAVFAPGSSYEGINCLHVLSYIMGLQIPRDVAIIGGEIPGISEVLCPPLTTIEEPLEQMAEQAANMIMALASGDKVPKRHVKLPSRLIERASVG